MNSNLEGYHRGVISGTNHGAAGFILRGALRLAEPFYAAVVSSRNALFEKGVFATHRADRPVISVGNITTGGTGKTPVVRWLVGKLRDSGHHPAILLRGYKGGDEQRLLQSQLDGVIVEANPSRVDGARAVFAANPQVDVFVLDDGFQHRRLRRDFDLVLIDATNPFGFNHVLPRGLLREPLAGLSRASAFLVTHAEMATPGELQEIDSTLKRHNRTAEIFRCSHHTTIPAPFSGKPVMTFCGIGNPAAFEKQIASQAKLVASHRFDDHHDYSLVDLSRLKDLARAARVEVLVTTEKDWVKVEPLLGHVEGLPQVVAASLAIRFEPKQESGLVDQIVRAINAQTNATAPQR